MSGFARDAHHPSIHNLAFLPFGNVFIEAAGDHLLHAKSKLAFFFIDREHLRFYALSHFENVTRMIDALFCADFAQMNHAFDSLRDLDEGTEGSDSGHRSFDNGAGGELSFHIVPGIAESLLQSKRHPVLCRIYAEHDGFNRFARFQQG
ncbi:MAG TPA: hypothetical protein VJQ59_05100, partial [Candidatus Sulfotelmatobacter sp.]|nr:hypothetical protein [Candidatus Sulfotelmatobacter sp.]